MPSVGRSRGTLCLRGSVANSVGMAHRRKLSAMAEKDEERASLRQVNKYLEIGLAFPAGTVAGLLIGYGLDRLFHVHFLYWVGMLAGIAGGFVQLIRLTSKD